MKGPTTFVWYPSRCEHELCEVEGGNTLLACSACKMVQYCTKEHELADWQTHKKDCKVFRRISVQALFYTDTEILDLFPLSTFKGKKTTGLTEGDGGGARTHAGHESDDDHKVCHLCGESNLSLSAAPCCGHLWCSGTKQMTGSSQSKIKVSTYVSTS